ncbi:MAG: hypothetical protein ABEK01_02820 [Candidatus Nanohaloarchaea archaeon]
MADPLIPDRQDIQDFLLISLVTGSAYATYFRTYSVEPIAVVLGLSAVVVATRELAVRLVAQWMDAYADLQVSVQGSALTIVGAILSILTNIPLILLFPLESSFRIEKYEHWAKDVDAVWAKREFWLRGTGVLALIAGSLAAGTLDPRLSFMYASFAVFQMMPFDYSEIPTGALDGAYIMRWSGFTWLVLTGLSLVALGFSL